MGRSGSSNFNFDEGKYAFVNNDIKGLLNSGLMQAKIADKIIERYPTKKFNRTALVQYIMMYRQALRDMDQYPHVEITTNKKIRDVHWAELTKWIQEGQRLKKKASGSNDYADWRIKTKEPVCVVFLGDTQLGSWGTDYDLFKAITKEIIETPNLYVVLVGDILQMAIKLRNVIENSDNAVPPDMQIMILDSWLQDIKHKVIASTWDNHSVMREEAVTGYSVYAEIFKRHTIYSSGICHLSVFVNDIEYKMAVSHYFRGRSMYNKTHAPSRYMREFANDRDLVAQGDFHEPGYSWYTEGGKERNAIVCGSIQTDSGYAKRFFTLTTHPFYPCVLLNHKEKSIINFKSVKDWLMLINTYKSDV